VAMLTGAGVLAWNFFTITDPYVVKLLSSSPAPLGSMTSFSVANDTRTLSVISSNDVVVVSDPGADFKYEVLWLVEHPRKTGTHALVEFRFKLPKSAAADKIELLGTEIPPKIRKVADGQLW